MEVRDRVRAVCSWMDIGRGRSLGRASKPALSYTHTISLFLYALGDPWHTVTSDNPLRLPTGVDLSFAPRRR